MRYYSINIDGAPPVFGAAGLGEATYTSFVGGKTLPNAWNVEFDIPVGPAASPMGGALIRVWGISIAEISQAADLVNKKIKVYGGMQRGLPLANPAQAGLLVQGYVFQAFGNWIGTDMTLDLIVQPGDPPGAATGGGTTGGGTGSYDRPINLVVNWKKGATLGSAIVTTLKTAFPGITTSVAASSNLVRQNDEVAYFQTLTQLGQWAKQMSKTIVKDTNYNGLEILLAGNAISVYDGSSQSGSTTRQIAFTDLIGQPTWIEAPTIQAKCVLRADIKVGDKIKLPQTAVTNTSQALSSLVPNQRVTFQGDFMVQQVRHLGSFRQPDANSWVTIINAAPTSLGGGTSSGG